MARYNVVVKYSKNGKTWSSISKTVNAESDFSAMALVQSQYSRYDYVEITKCVRLG